MGKIGRSWQLMKISFSVLKKDKEILIFPIISFIASIVILVSFFAGFFFFGIPVILDEPWLWIPIIFVLYIFLFFITIFFNTAVIACANIRLNGGDPTISDGLRIAGQNIGRIFIWAVISATIGMILQAIREKGGWAGKIASGIFGLAWTYVTFFIIPVLIYEKRGVLSSIKRSAQLFKITWGETIVGSIGFGIIFFLLSLIGIIPIILCAMTMNFPVIIIGFLAAFIYWAILGAIASATNGIYVAALYQYATKNELPSVYDPSLIPPLIPKKF